MSHTFLAFLAAIGTRTAIVALLLIGGLRILGKRQIGQMNIYDLAMIMALANAVQNAMTMGKGELSVGFVSSGTLLALGWILSLIFVRVPRIEERLCGTPTVLVSDGKLLTDHLHRERVTEEEVKMAMRQHGIEDIQKVEMAVLEVDGTISIVPRGEPGHRTGKRAVQVHPPNN